MELNRATRKPATVDRAGQSRGGLTAADSGSFSISKLAWYWNRLRCMSPVEVLYRLRQASLEQLQRRGIATARRVPAPTAAAGASFVATAGAFRPEQYLRAADALLCGKLTIFGQEYSRAGLPVWNVDPKTGRRAPLVYGKALEYRDAALVGDIKYVWEPNRHLHLVTLAQAHRLSGARRYLEGLRGELETWFDQCPYLLGPNWTSSLELAIRLINWSIVWQLIDGADSALFLDRRGQALREQWLRSVYQHMHFIRRHPSLHSSANNHLIGEQAGLYVAARTWPYWRDARRWGSRAKRCLVREASKQNASDGVNWEQAVSYQQFVLDFLLLAGFSGRANGDDFPVAYWQRIERMLEFIAAIMDARGDVPMIGDADDGYVVRLSQEPDFSPFRSLLATGAALFNRSDFKAKARRFDDKSRWLLGSGGAKKFATLAAQPESAFPKRGFPEGGYYILGSDFDTPREVRIVVDAGPLGYLRIAAHGHADALAFTLSIGGAEFLIDPGTYSYHTEREWRDYFRGTAAHNTVRVDGENQSVIGGAFLWTQHARAACETWQPGADADHFAGSHDGYRRLPDPVRHGRELHYDKRTKRLHVTDRIDARAKHRIERFWHFAEDVEVSLENDGAIVAKKWGYQMRIVAAGAALGRARYCRGETQPPCGWISRRFDVKKPTTTVVWENETNGASRFEAIIECSVAGVEAAVTAQEGERLPVERC